MKINLSAKLGFLGACENQSSFVITKFHIAVTYPNIQLESKQHQDLKNNYKERSS